MDKWINVTRMGNRAFRSKAHKHQKKTTGSASIRFTRAAEPREVKVAEPPKSLVSSLLNLVFLPLRTLLDLLYDVTFKPLVNRMHKDLTEKAKDFTQQVLFDPANETIEQTISRAEDIFLKVDSTIEKTKFEALEAISMAPQLMVKSLAQGTIDTVSSGFSSVGQVAGKLKDFFSSGAWSPKLLNFSSCLPKRVNHNTRQSLSENQSAQSQRGVNSAKVPARVPLLMPRDQDTLFVLGITTPLKQPLVGEIQEKLRGKFLLNYCLPTRQPVPIYYRS